MKIQKLAKFVAIIALFSAGPAHVWADINDVTPAEGFAYNTRKTIKVAIQVNTPNHEPSGLSFYSKGVDGLRLLDTHNLDETGQYQGKLTIPTYIKSIIVKSRWLDNFQEVEFKISGQLITGVIDHF